MNAFERYLDEFNNSIDLTDFLVNLIVAAILCLGLRWFYIHQARSISNRQRFANNFLPLGLTTMLVITIVKSSVALSLGLVGALSIVRFRAAIKDPEELTYLFLAIAIGLAAGANQPIAAVLAAISILLLVFGFQKSILRKTSMAKGGMYLHIQTDIEDLQQLSSILSKHFQHVELKRMDKKPNQQMNLSFLIQAQSIQSLESVKNELSALSDTTSFSLLDQPEVWV